MVFTINRNDSTTAVAFDGVYILTISSMADFDPKIRANVAIRATMTFLTSFHLNLPNPFSWKVNISIAIGTRSPMIEKQKAPIRETNGTIVGTAMAIPTQITTMTVRMMYWANNGLLEQRFLIPFQAMSRQT